MAKIVPLNKRFPSTLVRGDLFEALQDIVLFVSGNMVSFHEFYEICCCYESLSNFDIFKDVVDNIWPSGYFMAFKDDLVADMRELSKTYSSRRSFDDK